MENKLLQLKEAELCATEIVIKISATAIAIARCEIEPDNAGAIKEAIGVLHAKTSEMLTLLSKEVEELENRRKEEL